MGIKPNDVAHSALHWWVVACNQAQLGTVILEGLLRRLGQLCRTHRGRRIGAYTVNNHSGEVFLDAGG